MATTEPTVFIVDDDLAVCDALQALLESVNQPSKSYQSAPEFLESYEPACPGCLLLDVRMPGMSGLELQQELVDRNIDLPVIILTAHGDMRTAVQAMKSGAVDCVSKPFNDQVLLDRIHDAIRLDADRRRRRAAHAHASARIAHLSSREREVMDRVVAGLTNRQIAEELGVSTKTIEAHRAKVMEKTEADSLAELVRLAVKAIESDAGNESPAPGAPCSGRLG